jgi:hypothetical protein
MDELTASSPQPYCSYFFFKHGLDSLSTLSDCLRGLAFQMAMQDDLVKGVLLHLEAEGSFMDNNDPASIWRRLFLGCIFKIQSRSQHFWVIDALDECADFNILFSKRLLVTLPHEVRLFATSRNLELIERGISTLGSRVQSQSLTDSDTLDDMRSFLVAKLTEMARLATHDDREAMCEKILQKSSGSFLWVRLVLQELESAWTEEAMDAVLRTVPPGLHDIYSRIAQSIEEDPWKRPLAKVILAWVTLAHRPLTLDELRCAVKLELNQTMQNIAKAIPSICGQLLFVDHEEKVHMIHETAREFLLDESQSSDLVVRKKEGHGHLALLLLRYLSSGTLKRPQAKLQYGTKPRGFTKSVRTAGLVDVALLDYAAAFFSEHLHRCASVDDDLMEQLCTFLETNIQSWIEHLAKKKDLATVTRTATDIRAYLARRVKYIPPTHPSVHLVNGWVTDLIHVAAKFRSQLLAFPSSIHNLVPPLCPPDSNISRILSERGRRSTPMTVEGLPAGSWDDCLTRIDLQVGQASAVGHGDRFFAVGSSLGRIVLYDSASVQYTLEMKHPERVRILQFSQDDRYLASVGRKRLVVWQPKSGVQLYSFGLQSPPLAIVFLGIEELLVAFQSSELTKW